MSGEFCDVVVVIFGLNSISRINHDVIRIISHGEGLSCGMSLRG